MKEGFKKVPNVFGFISKITQKIIPKVNLNSTYETLS